MKKINSNINSVLAILLTLFFLSSCHDSPQNNQKKSALQKNNDKILNVDIGSEVPTLDPQLMQDMSSIRVANDLFAGLVSFSQSGEVVSGLADHWNVSNDGKTYTFHLRSDIKFSDGSPITANDFVYSWQRLANPKTGAPYTLVMASILNAPQIFAGKLPANDLGVKAINADTLVVTLSYPDVDFLAKCTRAPLYVTPKQAIEKHGKAWTEPQNMITSGAYKLKEHVINGYILIDKNPYYYNAINVKIPQVKFYPIVDVNSAVQRYKTGDLDMTWTIPVDQFASLKKQYSKQLHVTPIEATVYYNINMLRPEFKDIRLRKALSLAIDRNVLASSVLGTGVIPLYSVVTPTVDNGKYADITYSWKNISRHEQIKQAKALYKAAGYGVNHEFATTITYFTNDEQKKVALAIASMWKSVLGVNVVIENQDWKTFLQTRRLGNYAISFGRWYADYNGVSTYTPLFQCRSLVNYTQYCDSKYEEYITNATNAVDNNIKHEMYSKALRIALNDYSTIPLYQLVSERLIKPNIMGYIPEINHLDMVKSEWIIK